MKTETFKATNLTMILALLFLSFSMQGQRQEGQGKQQQGPPPIPTSKQINHMVNNLADEISLTDEQEEDVLNLYTSHFKELENKTKSGKPDREEMKSLRNEFHESVNRVLSEDQQDQYAAYIKEKQSKRKKR